MGCVIDSEDTILLKTEVRTKIRNFSVASLSLVIFAWKNIEILKFPDKQNLSHLTDIYDDDFFIDA
jgi:hypothetical protein